MPVKIGICVGAAYLGLQAPMLFLKNAITQAPALDQARLSRRARPAADLHRIRHVGRSRLPQGRRPKSCSQSVALSEEFTLTTAELSYLQDRKVAYENLAKRTGLEGVKSVCLALHAVGTLRHAARPEPARDGAGKPRHAHERGREEGRRAAAEADGADDPVLPAGACSSSFSGRPTSSSRRCSEAIGSRSMRSPSELIAYDADRRGLSMPKPPLPMTATSRISRIYDCAMMRSEAGSLSRAG